MSRKIILESFEGPLDLLLNLIGKAKIDIYNIPIHTITQQYMDYIYNMEKLNLEVASDFLVMASTLLQIKSKMLLPREKLIFDQEELEIDPREELVAQILIYKKFKELAIKLRELESKKDKTYSRPKYDLSTFENEVIDFNGFNLELLVNSLSNMLIKKQTQKNKLSSQIVEKEKYTIYDCTAIILKKLRTLNRINFSDLLDKDSTNNEIITYFLSLLELIKTGHILVRQKGSFSDLILEKMFMEES